MQHRSHQYDAQFSAFHRPIHGVKSSNPFTSKTSDDTTFDPQTEEVASFLLSLKHGRSVSPEPSDIIDQQVVSFNLDVSKSPMTITPVHELSPVRSNTSTSRKESSNVHLTKEKVATHSPSSLRRASGADWNFSELLDHSPLVLLEDRDLVPDALFVAMSQMKVCHLTQADRVGCYKSREIGFKGMCCKHCGGQPGFGRYYPNSVRSLAQTTTSQTILKHIGGKCRYAPTNVRDAVLQLQQEQAVQEGLTSGGRPRYGSRKVFFQRVWERLHGSDVSFDDDTISKVSCSSSTDGMSLQSDNDDRSTMSLISEEAASTMYEKTEGGSKKRKNRLGTLPLSKSVKTQKVVFTNCEV